MNISAQILFSVYYVVVSSWLCHLAYTVCFDALHSVHSCSESLLLFQLNVHMLNTYIYHQLPPTCIGVCYTIFRETIVLLIQILYAFCGVVT
jgi:hypothetical protein